MAEAPTQIPLLGEDPSLEARLAVRADRMHEYVARKIPAALRHSFCPEDVLQDVWIAAFRGYPHFRDQGNSAFDRWLMSITQRTLIDAIRRGNALKRGGGRCTVRGARERSTTYLDLFAAVTDTGRTPSSADAAREAIHAVQIALSGLPEDQRRAVTLRHIEGKPHGEVATAMNKSRPAVNGLLYRGLQTMRRTLQPAGRFFSDDR